MPLNKAHLSLTAWLLARLLLRLRSKSQVDQRVITDTAKIVLEGFQMGGWTIKVFAVVLMPMGPHSANLL
jgi:hypothetical protein